MNAPKVFGHKVQRDTLARLARSNKLAQTLLFCGMPGIGKSLVARELAGILLCQTPTSDGAACGACTGCRQLQSNSHPDFFYMDAAATESADVAAIRKLMYGLNLRPYYGGNRVVVFDNAEALGPQSVNVLLKSLEEPRPSTYFIMIAANRSLLLPTLVSRSHVYHFDSLREDELRNAMQGLGLTENLEQLVALADGSLAQLSRLKENVAEAQGLLLRLEQAIKGDQIAGCSLAQELSKEKDRLAERLLLLCLGARRSMTKTNSPELQRRWAEAFEALSSLNYAIFERNLNALALLTAAFTGLAAPTPAISRTAIF